MDPSSNSPSEEQKGDLDPAFVDRLKVAAATAIIKQKPAAMTGKAYAEQLAKRLRGRNDTWKAKAKTLEAELLKTKQELLLAQAAIPAVPQSNEPGATNNTSSTTSSSPGAAFLTPPSSSEDYPQPDHKGALSQNTTFLFSISALSSLSDIENCSKLRAKSFELITKSVQTAINFILGRIRGRPECQHISLRMVQEAADSVVRSLESEIAVGCREEITASVTKLVECILDEVLANSCLCNTFSQRESCCIILRLSKSFRLLPVTLQALLERIEKTSSSLRSIRRHANGPDAQLLENSCFLFSTMEDILVSANTASSAMMGEDGKASVSTSRHKESRHTGPTLTWPVGGRSQPCAGKKVRACDGGRSRQMALDPGFKTNIQQRLEDSLLHISSDFPLYAQYIWRLTGILELMSER